MESNFGNSTCADGGMSLHSATQPTAYAGSQGGPPPSIVINRDDAGGMAEQTLGDEDEAPAATSTPAKANNATTKKTPTRKRPLSDEIEKPRARKATKTQTESKTPRHHAASGNGGCTFDSEDELQWDSDDGN